MKLLKVLLTLALFITLGQAKDVQSKEDVVGDLWKKQVSAAKAEINKISPEELMKWNKEDKKFVLLDVREGNEVLAGWIEADMLKKIPRGALAGKMLKDLGFKNIYNLEGGIHGWMNAGQPIVSSLGTFKTVPYELTGCAE